MKRLVMMIALAASAPAMAQALLGIGSAQGESQGPVARAVPAPQASQPGYVIVQELAVRADRGFAPARHAPGFGNGIHLYESVENSLVTTTGTCVGQAVATHLFFRDFTLGQPSGSRGPIGSFLMNVEGTELAAWLRTENDPWTRFGRVVGNLHDRLGCRADRGERMKNVAHSASDALINAATLIIQKRGTALLEMVLHGTGKRFTPGKHALLGYRVADVLVQAGGAEPEPAVAIRVWDPNVPRSHKGHAVLAFPDGRVTYTAGMLAHYGTMALPAGRAPGQAIEPGADLTVWTLPAARLAEVGKLAVEGPYYLRLTERTALAAPDIR